jgi:imidazoleglycerol-phosphate dehydratase
MTKTGRSSEVSRMTKETSITLQLGLDGQGKADIDTGVPFLDHMLTLFAVHGFFDLTVAAKGDTAVDDHHTVEDIGICLGQAIRKALGEKGQIRRYGNSAIPMDETLARVTLDLSNRPFLHYGVAIKDQKVGTFDTALTEEFLRALAIHAGLTLHVEVPYGESAHHIIEAVFKALAKALDMATTAEPRLKKGPLSSKGML